MLVNSLESLGFLSVFKAYHKIVSVPEDNDDREVRISFSKWRPVQGQATVGSFNAHCSGSRLRSIAVRIDIGRLSPTFPVTPPDMRVRIRRFGGLSYVPANKRGSPSESK